MVTFSVNNKINSVISELSPKVFQPLTDDGRQWLSDLWFKIIDGEVDNKVKPDAYGYVCEQNTKMAKSKKETALLTADELDDGLKGVLDTVASYNDTNLKEFIENSEVETLVKEFVDMHEYLFVEEGVNLWKIVILAYNSNMRAIERLKYLIKEYHMESLIYSVIEKKECLKRLEIELDQPIHSKTA
jgi:hypothetical protein